MDTLAALVASTRARLAEAPNPPHPREAELLVRWATGATTTDLVAHPERPVEPASRARLDAALARRLAGEPLQHLFGEWEFYGRTFRVDRRALVPRPETEHLIEALLEHRPDAATLLDLGTGSGILAVTAALELPRLRVVAIDRSPAALTLARANFRLHDLRAPRAHLLGSIWDAALAPGFVVDAILANPPYLDPAEIERLAPEVRDWEPPEALADPRGAFAAIADVIAVARRRLAAGGLLALEVGLGQAAEAVDEAEESGLEVVEVRTDLAGIERSVVARAISPPTSSSDLGARSGR